MVAKLHKYGRNQDPVAAAIYPRAAAAAAAAATRLPVEAKTVVNNFVITC
jgi:hypothetical protein